jgi:hypothetical protein
MRVRFGDVFSGSDYSPYSNEERSSVTVRAGTSSPRATKIVPIAACEKHL